MSPDGAITDPKSLAALGHFQNAVAELPGVQAVIGPSQAAKRGEPLQDLGNAVLSSEGNIGPVKRLGRLGRNLGAAAAGVAQLREGISEASNGAGLLALGSDRAGAGAQMIAVGLDRAISASQRAITALDRFTSGTKRLAEADEKAAVAALPQKFAAGDIRTNLRANALQRSFKLEESLAEDGNATLPRLLGPAKVADEQLRTALAQPQGMTVGQSDPDYAAAVEAVRRASAAVSGTRYAAG